MPRLGIRRHALSRTTPMMKISFLPLFLSPPLPLYFQVSEV